MPHRPLVSLACVLLASACSTATSPSLGSEAGRYVARTIDGRSAPALVDTSATEFAVLLADTLELDGHGSARRAIAIHRVEPSLGVDTVYHTVRMMSYRLNGAQLELGSFAPCPPAAVCMANDTGDLTPVGLLLVTFQYGAGSHVALSRASP
jgi:hypothetical protein